MKSITLQQHNKNLIEGKYKVANLLHKNNEFDQVVFIEQITKTGKRFFRDLIVIDYYA
jgi:hypothetical protein